MGQVFVSYSRADEKFVHQLADDLKACGADVWDDREITALNWVDAIQHALDQANVMILVLTPPSMVSSEVRKEWRYFEDQKNEADQHKPILPLLLKKTNIPYRLHELRYIDFRDKDYGSKQYREAFKQLLTALRALGVQCTDRAPETPTPPFTTSLDNLPQLHMEPNIENYVLRALDKLPKTIWRPIAQHSRAFSIIMVVLIIALVGVLWTYDRLNGPSTDPESSGPAALTATYETERARTLDPLRTESAATYAAQTAAVVTATPTLVPATATPTPTPTVAVDSDREATLDALRTAAAHAAETAAYTTPTSTATATALPSTPDRTATWFYLKTAAAHATETATMQP
ncbi:MAG: toll/interleukin-1 receptor domain-containing protein [Anaerolineae bacterium]|nr:toll/interleukin-1 receptor domain-containing protein [Anaerolineae bacterium]